MKKKNFSNFVIGLSAFIVFLAAVGCANPTASSESESSDSKTALMESAELSLASSSKPVGFASLDGGTTGGQGGVTKTFSSFSAMEEYFKLRSSNNPKKKITEKVIVYIDGTMTGSDMLDVKRTFNVSFIGRNNAVAKGWGINIRESNNVIVENITFDNYSDDGVAVDTSHNVWVHHNTFKKGKDGSCDVKKGSYNVTVSWNKFIGTQKTCLFGHSTSQTSDTALRCTYHHNYFQGARSRMPRARYGKAHVFNNYFENVGLYAIASTCDAQVLSEKNYFKNCSTHTIIYPKSGSAAADILSHNPVGKVKSVGDVFSNSAAPMINDGGFSFKPPYSYSSDSASNVPSIVKSGAGAR